MLVRLTKGIVINHLAHKLGDEINLSGSDLTYVLNRGLGVEVKVVPAKRRKRRVTKRKED